MLQIDHIIQQCCMFVTDILAQAIVQILHRFPLDFNYSLEIIIV